MSRQISPLSAAAILRDRGSRDVRALDDRALILALIEAFHATGRRAAEIPQDLAAVRAAVDPVPLSAAA